MSHITWTIGDLAARTGLSVKTIRYYSDTGLLPMAQRSAGGHRRYAYEALEQLRLVQQLRALDTPIATITQLATGERSLGDLVTRALNLTRTRLAELSWRQATLQALDDCSDQERLRRLAVLSRVQRLSEAPLDLGRAWERVIPAAVPARLVDLITAQAVPEPPQDPSPQTALAYAELHALIAQPGFRMYWAAPHVRDKASLYAELVEAAELAKAAVAAGLPPQPGEALDKFSRACTRARGEDDSPGFRALMGAEFHTTVPLFRCYWQHIATLTADHRPNVGNTHCWLVEALITTYQHTGST
ncbi:helix-turn-helix domain-containing protein [Streptomyces jumonjinensis]|uniref:MerR family DNA-binding transcriptional regulator n=1 Tax=Streptomyces jumonjinensis TaxID=1945 RepID=A0A646KSF8_STRJU|nr:MerR family transcriptional regulator [Streptomyces jumonjinensis]MQT05193.1 MerR family DNA-binding transcriptional regulator [Streptomyces jumonjinensis]